MIKNWCGPWTPRDDGDGVVDQHLGIQRTCSIGLDPTLLGAQDPEEFPRWGQRETQLLMGPVRGSGAIGQDQGLRAGLEDLLEVQDGTPVDALEEGLNLRAGWSREELQGSSALEDLP